MIVDWILWVFRFKIQHKWFKQIEGIVIFVEDLTRHCRATAIVSHDQHFRLFARGRKLQNTAQSVSLSMILHHSYTETDSLAAQ